MKLFNDPLIQWFCSRFLKVPWQSFCPNLHGIILLPKNNFKQFCSICAFFNFIIFWTYFHRFLLLFDIMKKKVTYEECEKWNEKVEYDSLPTFNKLILWSNLNFICWKHNTFKMSKKKENRKSWLFYHVVPCSLWTVGEYDCMYVRWLKPQQTLLSRNKFLSTLEGQTICWWSGLNIGWGIGRGAQIWRPDINENIDILSLLWTNKHSLEQYCL